MDNALAQLDALVGKGLELQSASPAPEESSNKAQDEASGGDITSFKLFSTSKSEAAPLVHLELKEHKEEHGHVEDRRIRAVEDLPKRDRKRLRKQAEQAAVDFLWLQQQKQVYWPHATDPSRELPPVHLKHAPKASSAVLKLRKHKRGPKLTQQDYTVVVPPSVPTSTPQASSTHAPKASSKKSSPQHKCRKTKRFSQAKRQALRRSSQNAT